LALYPVGGSKDSGDAEGMVSKKTVTMDNLVALGPERLAAILVELADGDAKIKRRRDWNWPRRPAMTPSPPRSASASAP